MFIVFATAFCIVVNDKIPKNYKPHWRFAHSIFLMIYNLIYFQSTQYIQPPYTDSHPTIKMFWKVFHALDNDMKRKFLGKSKMFDLPFVYSIILIYWLLWEAHCFDRLKGTYILIWPWGAPGLAASWVVISGCKTRAGIETAMLRILKQSIYNFYIPNSQTNLQRIPTLSFSWVKTGQKSQKVWDTVCKSSL